MSAIDPAWSYWGKSNGNGAGTLSGDIWIDPRPGLKFAMRLWRPADLPGLAVRSWHGVNNSTWDRASNAIEHDPMAE